MEVIFNPDYNLGMFSSVLAGFRQVQKERIFFTPGDYPLISKETYQDMLKVSGDIVVPVYKGRKGHPVLIKHMLIEELLNGSKYLNLNKFIISKGYVTVPVQDQGVLLDIDTIQDYYKVLECAANSQETLGKM